MREKVKEWIDRYLLAEVLSTILSLATVYFTLALSDDSILAAYLGSIIASVSFYGIILFREIQFSVAKSRDIEAKYTWLSFLKDSRNIAVEFGISEVLDVLVVRPFFIYWGLKTMKNDMIGTLFGKILADIVFFLPAIVMYELRKSRFQGHHTFTKHRICHKDTKAQRTTF
jgi:hypothetical protein